MQDHRPISLLNTDYKLFTKILSKRIALVLDRLLGPGQCATVDGRSCTDNLKDIRRLVTRSVESKRFKGFLLSVDLERAFDNVDHAFLWKVLEKFSFPAGFIQCLKSLYNKATSKILLHGFLTPEVKIQSSVRQGCPLSMILFVLYVEPLIRNLHASSSGVLVYGKFLKVIAYADDITIFVRGQDELDLVMQIIESFTQHARIRVNLQKSSFLRLNNARSGPQKVREVDELTILGVIFAGCWSKVIDKNYSKLIRSIQFRLLTNAQRNLNILERVWILNTFVLSKLWYIAQVFPPKNCHLAKIKSMVGNFLWSGSVFRVARDQLYLDHSRGGLRLVDPESKCKALFVKNILNLRNDVAEEKYLLDIPNNGRLTRNAKEWIELARLIDQEANPEAQSCKQLYYKFLRSCEISVRVEDHFPDEDWFTLWKNTSYNFLCSEDRSNIFLLLNDVIANKEKLLMYKIGRLSDGNCESCGVPDSNLHRVTECNRTKEIRQWTEQILKNRLRVNFSRIDEILNWSIDENDLQQKAALWLVMHCISWSVKVKRNSLFCFQKSIREIRWTNRRTFAVHFGNNLNIC